MKSQVQGFIGQEITHGREHREVNERLAEMGYRSVKVDRHVKWLLAVGDRFLSKNQRLAITAARHSFRSQGTAGALIWRITAKRPSSPRSGA